MTCCASSHGGFRLFADVRVDTQDMGLLAGGYQVGLWTVAMGVEERSNLKACRRGGDQTREPWGKRPKE